MVTALIAQIAGGQVIQALMFLIVLGVVFWLLWWLISYIGLPEPFNKVANVILAIAAVFLLINVLLSLVGHPLVSWQ